jgi:uncharacterized protein (TIGR02646 family)
MRQIITIAEKLQIENIPSVLQSEKCQTHLKKLIKGEVKTINSDYYRGENNEIVNKLRDLYVHKCVYCEKRENNPQVEHYRPSSKYLWLCYEWTNLFPICADCNSALNGKGDRFPLLSAENEKTNPSFSEVFDASGQIKREICSANSDFLLSEKPVILNPEVDNPFEFIRLNQDGTLSGIDAEGRGEQTILICNVKERGDLVESRLEIIDKVKGEILDAFDRFLVSSDKEMLKSDFYRTFLRLSARAEINRTFSFSAQCVFNNFLELVTSQFPIPYQKTIQTAFDKYRAGTLI